MQFEVFEVSKAGELKRTSVTLANVLRDFGVHARDMLSLGLQVRKNKEELCRKGVCGWCGWRMRKKGVLGGQQEERLQLSPRIFNILHILQHRCSSEHHDAHNKSTAGSQMILRVALLLSIT